MRLGSYHSSGSNAADAGQPEPTAGPSGRATNAPVPRYSSHTTVMRSIKHFWRRQISLTVPFEACRDNLALERTYLGYLRTSLALCMISVTVSQLFRLQLRPGQSPPQKLSYSRLGRPIAGLLMALAILVCLVGAYRFWRQQNAIRRGMVHVGGWEMTAIGVLIALSLVITFALLVAVPIS